MATKEVAKAKKAPSGKAAKKKAKDVYREALTPYRDACRKAGTP